MRGDVKMRYGIFFLFYASLIFQLGLTSFAKDCDKTLFAVTQCFDRKCEVKKSGYVDMHNNTVIPFKFNWALSFVQGLGYVWEDGKTGFIDTKGKYVIGPYPRVEIEFIPHPYVVHGFIFFKVDQGFGGIRLDGRRFFNPIYNWVYFDDTYIILTRDCSKEEQGCYRTEIYDRKGNLYKKVKEEVIYGCREDICTIVDEEKHEGYMNVKTGKIIVQPKYDKAFQYYEGLAFVDTIDSGIWVIDKEGKVKYGPYFYRTDAWNYRYSEGLALVKKEVDDHIRYIYIDHNGKVKLMLPEEYVFACHFFEGLACFAVEDSQGREKYGYIDKSGRVVIEPMYESVSDFQNGLAVVGFYEGKEMRVGVINKSNEWVIPPQYNEIYISKICHTIPVNKKAIKEFIERWLKK